MPSDVPNYSEIPNWIANIDRVEPHGDADIKLVCSGREDEKRCDVTVPLSSLFMALQAVKARSGLSATISKITVVNSDTINLAGGEKGNLGVPLRIEFADGKTNVGAFVKRAQAAEFAKLFLDIAIDKSTAKH